MISKNIIVRLHNYANSIEIAVVQKVGEQSLFAKPCSVEFSEIPQACVSLQRSEAQELLQQLWGCGLRPSGYESGDETLKAVRYHLEDFRRLVFEKKNEEGE